MKNEFDVDGLIVTLMGKSYEVVKMDRYEETTKKGERYNSGEVIDLIVKSAIVDSQFPQQIKAVAFFRNNVELEKLDGEVSIEPRGQETRITLRTIPKPIHLPDIDQDAIGKAS
jgi:hypothetical protein